MSRNVVVLVMLISLFSKICNASIEDVEEGDDLCRVLDVLKNKDKVVIDEIRVEDVKVVPLEKSTGGLVNVRPRATVVVMQRSLVGNGAHREVHTDITVEVELDQDLNVARDCDLIVIEKFSNGVFADPFQLQRLRQQGAFEEVHIYGDVDLERPARTSYPSAVEMRKSLMEVETNTNITRLLRSKVVLPLHARYPPIRADIYFQLNISMPQVMVNCRQTSVLARDYDKNVCIHAATELPVQTLHWFIPSGRPQHSSVVDGVTTIAALTGVAVIFVASKFSNLR